MSRRRERESDGQGFEEPSLVPMADMLTNTVGVIVFILVFTVLAASGGELLKHLPEEVPTAAEPRYYICSGGRLYHLNESLVAGVRKQFASDMEAAKSEEDLLGKSWTLGDDSMDIVLHFERIAVTRGKEPTRHPIRLSAEVVLKPTGGETGMELARPGSAFRRDLATTTPKNEFVMIWLKPDGMGVFHVARDVAIQAGFQVGWSPESPDEPIEFGFGYGGDGNRPGPQQDGAARGPELSKRAGEGEFMASVNINRLLNTMVEHQAARATIVNGAASYFESADKVQRAIHVTSGQCHELRASLQSAGRSLDDGRWLVDANSGTWQIRVDSTGPLTLHIERYEEPDVAWATLDAGDRSSSPPPPEAAGYGRQPAPTAAPPEARAAAGTGRMPATPLAPLLAPVSRVETVSPPPLPHDVFATPVSSPAPPVSGFSYPPSPVIAAKPASVAPASFRNIPTMRAALEIGRSGRSWTGWTGMAVGLATAVVLGLTLPRGSMLGKVFSLRNPGVIIPALIIGAFYWGLLICLHRIRRQSALGAFTSAGVVDQAVAILGSGGSLASLSAEFKNHATAVQASPALRRLDAVVSQWLLTPGMDEADILLSEHARRDSRELESAWSLPRTLIWALPVLGLIGTVIGISFAVANFASFLASEISDINLIKENLVGVTGGLSFSFLITLMGLATSLILMLLVSSLQTRERRAIGNIEREIVDRFLPALQAAAPVPTNDRGRADELSQTLTRNQEALAEQLRASFGSVSREIGEMIGQSVLRLGAPLSSAMEQYGLKMLAAMEQRANQAAQATAAATAEHLQINKQAAEAVMRLALEAQTWKTPIKDSASKVIESFDQAAVVLKQVLEDRFNQRADALGATIKAQQDAVQSSARTIGELAQATQAAGGLVTSLRDAVAALGAGAIPSTLEHLKGTLQEFSKVEERTATVFAEFLRHTETILKSQASLLDATRQLEEIGLPAAMHSVKQGIDGIAPVLASFRQPMVLQFAPVAAPRGMDGVSRDHPLPHAPGAGHGSHARPALQPADEEAVN